VTTRDASRFNMAYRSRLMRAIVAVESAIADAPLGCPFPNLRKKKIADLHFGQRSAVFTGFGSVGGALNPLARGASWNLLLACELRLPNRTSIIAIASYEVVGSGVSGASNTMASLWAATKTKESAFEAAVPAASLAVRERYEVQLSVQSGFASNPNRHGEAKRAAGVTRAETGSTSPLMSAHSRNPPS